MSNPDSRLQRIARMEDIFDRSDAAVNNLLQAIEQYAAIKPELDELTAYYTGGEWLSDFDADRAGRIPRDMKRGILTEDAIYDLLTDEFRMQQFLSALLPRNTASEDARDEIDP